MSTPPQNPLANDLAQVVDRLSADFEELRGRALMITGGVSLYTCWLVESFVFANRHLDLGARLLLLTDNEREIRHAFSHVGVGDDEYIQIQESDITSFPFPTGDFSRVSHIIHAAAHFDVTTSAPNPATMSEVIVNGTQRVFDFAQHSGAIKVLFTGSGAVYPVQPPDMMLLLEEFADSDEQPRDNSPYGIGMRKGEKLCHSFGREANFEIKMARGHALVGAYLPLDAHFAMGNFIRDAMNGGPIVIKGDGTAHRSYLYGADLMVWLWTILFRGKALRPYNVGSEDGRSLGEVAHAVAGHFSPVTEVEIRQKAKPDSPPARYIPSTERARKELGLEITVPFEDAVSKTIEWHRRVAHAASV